MTANYKFHGQSNKIIMAKRKLTSFSWFIISTISIFMIVVLLTVFGGGGIMTNEKAANRALKDAGYHPISVGGYGWFDCSEDDFYKTRFSAYSSDSTRIVNGCVCQGLFKGKTIRLD